VKRNAKLTVRVREDSNFLSSFQYTCVRVLVCSKKNIESKNVNVSAFACRVEGCYHWRVGRFEVLMVVLLESSLQECYAVWTGKRLPAFGGILVL
jgi:hypothetical protein